MTAEQRLSEFLLGLGPLLQQAMLSANNHGEHDLRQRLQLAYMNSLQLLAGIDIPVKTTTVAKTPCPE